MYPNDLNVMEAIWRSIRIYIVEKNGKLCDKFDRNIDLICEYDPQGMKMKIFTDEDTKNPCAQFLVTNETNTASFGDLRHIINFDTETICVDFESPIDSQKFRKCLGKVRRPQSVFAMRTEESSASQYFQFYGYLSQQQNMMQDYVRTSTYQKAILGNLSDFNGKIILDVGAGSGILSFFALQAGANKVYAIEASNMANFAQQLVHANQADDRIVVIPGKIEEVDVPQMVDVIISEPMGYMLYNERMLETYLHARKWLRPGGKMFPSEGDLHVAPFSDEALYMEQYNKANFWYQKSFHGVNLTSLHEEAMQEYFRQPIVDTFDIRICMSKSVKHSVDFSIASETDLHLIDIPLQFQALQTGICHGLAFWFDVAFNGSTQQIWLSTSPVAPLTHWYQVRCLLQNPIYVRQGQTILGQALLVANKRQSYDVTISLRVEGTNTASSNVLDLKNPYFRYTGAPTQAPHGTTTQSPSEVYWSHLDTQQQGSRNGTQMYNY